MSSSTILKRVKQETTDGRPPIQYRIQLVDETLIEEVVAFMIKYHLPQSVALAPLYDTSDSNEVEKLKSVYLEKLVEGISLAAFLEDGQGNRGDMIGCNVLNLERNGHLETHMADTEKMKIVEQTLKDLKAKCDVFARHNCTSYVASFGLAVVAAHERRGIATEMLRARERICRIAATPISASVFSAEASQKAAARCGYQTLAQLDLTSYRVNGQAVYPSPKWPVIKWMAMRYY